jgi:putative tryptophan/tyrosine transport system substrate-binding protein
VAAGGAGAAVRADAAHRHSPACSSGRCGVSTYIDEVEHSVAAFALQSNGGLIVTGSAFAQVHREQIVGLAARHRLPSIYPYRYLATAGGLISYGPRFIDQYRATAGYVDRILKGEKPADLPVQAPTKYELVLNIKTAETLGIEVPPLLLARADEVIEFSL